MRSEPERILILRDRVRKSDQSFPVLHCSLAFRYWVKSAHKSIPGPAGQDLGRQEPAGQLLLKASFISTRDPVPFSACAMRLKKKKGEEYWCRKLTILVFYEVLVLKHLKLRLTT